LRQKFGLSARAGSWSIPSSTRRRPGLVPVGSDCCYSCKHREVVSSISSDARVQSGTDGQFHAADGYLGGWIGRYVTQAGSQDNFLSSFHFAARAVTDADWRPRFCGSPNLVKFLQASMLFMWSLWGTGNFLQPALAPPVTPLPHPSRAALLGGSGLSWLGLLRPARAQA